MTYKFLVLTTLLLAMATKAFCDPASDYVDSGVTKFAVNNDFDGAISDYTKAIELKPDYADAYLRRAQAEKSKGDYDAAIADDTKYIALKPADATTFFDQADG